MKRHWPCVFFMVAPIAVSPAFAESSILVCFGSSPGGEFLDCASSKSGLDDSKRNTSIFALTSSGWRLVDTLANTAQLSPNPSRAYYFFFERAK